MKNPHAWPLAMAAVLAITVVANLALLVAANAPGAAQVEPDYYRRALAWDSTQAERARSAALGWRAAARFIPRPGHPAWIVVDLADASGRAVTGARLGLVAVHNLEPGASSSWTLTEVAPGRYRAEVAPHHAGRWELRLAASHERERFTAILHADLAQAPPIATTTGGPAR